MLRFLHWRSLFRRKSFESGLAEEFAFHLQARTEDLVRAGVSRHRSHLRVPLAAIHLEKRACCRIDLSEPYCDR